MLQHGLHPESGETPASESLEESCTSPAVLLHWTPPSLLPSHGCGLKPDPQKPTFQFSPGCELQADGPKHRHPGLLTSTAAHWSPPVLWLQRLIQKCQPSFQGTREVIAADSLSLWLVGLSYVWVCVFVLLLMIIMSNGLSFKSLLLGW